MQRNFLCCCEYNDVNGERNHILACCCNCIHLDEICESIVSCKRIDNRNKSGLMTTLLDRLRYPWYGGAKKIPCDILLPPVIITFVLLFASVSLNCTITVAITSVILISYLFFNLNEVFSKPRFFFYWTIFSVLILYLIFQIVVVPFLEILLEENILLGFLIGCFIMCVYFMKKKIWSLRIAQNSTIIKTEIKRSYQCNICQLSVPSGEFHSYWYDCCVGQQNVCLYICAQFFALLSLLYSSNLTLTTVCHPYIFYETILLPDDCSDVYKQFEYSLSFVSAVYSLTLAFFVFVSFIQQIFLVSIGMTYQEWQQLNFRKKISFYCLHRPYNIGFFSNWIRACTYEDKS